MLNQRNSRSGSQRRSRAWIGYAIALASVAGATALRLALNPLWGPTDRPFIFYFAAVLGTAWAAGLAPAIVSLGLSAVAATLFFFGPVHALGPTNVSFWSALLAFVAMSGFFACAMEAMHRQRRRADAARDEAIRANQAKDRFIALLSHELRTPLNPVLLLASDYASDPNLPADLRSDFETIASNIAIEARLIDDLLDFSSIEHGKMRLKMQPLDVHETLAATVKMLESEQAERRITYRLKLDAERRRMSGDPTRLRQVFWNVLKNAAKFSPAMGCVEVVTSNTPALDKIEITVRDSGIGMSPEEIARAFEPFAQGDHRAASGSASYAGLGLGLTIARSLVERHGGTIAIASEGKSLGTRVLISLPLMQEETS